MVKKHVIQIFYEILLNQGLWGVLLSRLFSLEIGKSGSYIPRGILNWINFKNGLGQTMNNYHELHHLNYPGHLHAFQVQLSFSFA